MIDLSKFNENNDKEAKLYQCVIAFNTIYKARPTTATQYSYYQLWEFEGKRLALSDWKDFILDARVQEWYDLEFELALNSNLQKLVTEAGQNKSTATLQALSTMLKYKDSKVQDTPDSNKIFIYTHIPLTDVEEKLENVKILRTKPEEISNAIKVFEGSKNV